MRISSLPLWAFAQIVSIASCHPEVGVDPLVEADNLRIRGSYGASTSSSLSRCHDSLAHRALHERAVLRRAATLERLRRSRSLHTKHSGPSKARRDLAGLRKWEAVPHDLTGSIDLRPPHEPSDLFAGNTSAVLAPESMLGPYWVSGELLRSNISESQPGIPLHLDIQFVDVSTCDVVSRPLVVDVWACNATGMYSGVDGQAGLQTTWLRGVQAADEDGVVEFDTVFPGHYHGRATHVHVATHIDPVVLPNGTYAAGTVAHIGQLYFPETLRHEVEATWPYTRNGAPATSNNADRDLVGVAGERYDPFPKFVQLGESLQDGLLAWISIGIDLKADYTDDAVPAAYWREDGGHENKERPGPPGGGRPGHGPPGRRPPGSHPPGGPPHDGPGGEKAPPYFGNQYGLQEEPKSWRQRIFGQEPVDASEPIAELR